MPFRIPADYENPILDTAAEPTYPQLLAYWHWLRRETVMVAKAMATMPKERKGKLAGITKPNKPGTDSMDPRRPRETANNP